MPDVLQRRNDGEFRIVQVWREDAEVVEIDVRAHAVLAALGRRPVRESGRVLGAGLAGADDAGDLGAMIAPRRLVAVKDVIGTNARRTSWK